MSTAQEKIIMSRARGAKERDGDNNGTSGAAANNKLATSPTVAAEQHLIGAIDQGTSSTRFLVFKSGTDQLVASSQLEIKRIIPKEGWVEIDPDDIMDSVNATVAAVSQQLQASQSSGSLSKGINGLKCIGICNQRESTVVWDSVSGRALYNVIVWMDSRTKDIVDQMIDSAPGRDFNWLKDKTGLPMSTYFSAFKLKWLIDNVPEVRQALAENRLLFGTVDSWILWNLTGKHLTDVTNASRTFLMDIETLNWDESLCQLFGIPMKILPKILSSADDFGLVQHGPLEGLPVTGVIGDQSAALFGQNCLQTGQTKATFGTGCFIMQNIGPAPLNNSDSSGGFRRAARRGLITTVGYKLRNRPACYALEGSIKIAGAALTWMRDNMQLIQNYDECDQLVNMTTHSSGVFFVPALGGLYSPYWDPNAAGLYIGLSQFTRREHLVRATFDSIAFQTNDILALMRGVTNGLMIDGGLCKSDNMCQILADITGCDIVKPSMCETSALGAAMVAGCGADIWPYEQMLANSNTPYEYSSSANQNHHYPPECLHCEDKTPSIIQSRNSLTSTRPNKPANGGRSLANRTSACNLDAGGGVNDDAGGGSRTNNNQTQAPLTPANVCQPATVVEVDSSGDDGDVDDNNAPSSLADELDSGSSQLAVSSSLGYTDTNATCEEDDNGATTLPEYCLTIEACCSGYDSAASFDASSSELIETPHSQAQAQAEAINTNASCNSCAMSAEGSKLLQQAKPVDVFQSYISLELRTELVNTWRLAVGRSMHWNKTDHEEIRQLDYQRLSSLPISMFAFFSVGILALSGLLTVANGGRGAAGFMTN